MVEEADSDSESEGESDDDGPMDKTDFDQRGNRIKKVYITLWGKILMSKTVSGESEVEQHALCFPALQDGKPRWQVPAGSLFRTRGAAKFPCRPRRRRPPWFWFYCPPGGGGYLFVVRGPPRKAVSAIADGP